MDSSPSKFFYEAIGRKHPKAHFIWMLNNC